MGLLRRWTDVDDDRAMLRLRRLVVFVLVAGLVACAGESGSAPADPTLLEPGQTQGPVTTIVPTTAATGTPNVAPVTTDVDGRDDAVAPPDPAGVPPTAVPTPGRAALAGFGEVAVVVRGADGAERSWCLLLAESAAQMARGLMEVTDPALGGYDGMLFRYADDGERAFYMRNTALQLSIAYLDAGGGLVSSTVMEPCPDQDGCPTYPSGGATRYVVEVPVAAGGVERLGIVPGAVLTDTARTCAAPSVPYRP